MSSKIGAVPILFGMVIVLGRASGYSLMIGNVAHERVQAESEMDGERRQVSAGLNEDGITQGGY